MTVTVYSRTINGKKGKWEFHSSYIDGMPDGKKEKENMLVNLKKKIIIENTK